MQKSNFNSKLKITLFFLLLLVLKGFSQCKTINLLPNQDIKKKISNEFITFYKDSTNKLEFQNILNDNLVFKKPDNYSIAESTSTTWFCIKVRNQSHKIGQWILAVSNIAYLNFYVINENGEIEKIKAGNKTPASQKQIKNGMQELCSFYLNGKESKTIYIKAKSDVAVKIQNLFTLYNAENYNELNNVMNFVEGLFNGILLMMFIYNLFLYFMIRQKVYLYYSLYIFNISLSILALLQYFCVYFFAETPQINQYIGFSFFIAYIFYYLFIREFLDSKQNNKRLDKILKILIRTIIIFTILIITISFFNYFAFALLSLLFIIFNMLILLLLIISIFRKGNKILKILALGSSSLILGTFISASSRLLGFPAGISLVSFQLSIVAELFIFSAGLSYKYKLSEQKIKDSQQKLILQFKENEQLQTKVARVLEQKVNERTNEIFQKNEKINLLYNELSMLDKFKESTISMLVHDLKNPLNLILNTSENRKVKQATFSMLNLVTNILDVNKEKKTNLNLTIKELDLIEILKISINRIEFLLEQKNIMLETNYFHKTSIVVDSDYTIRVFENLLTNAIKYSPNNSKIIINSIDNAEFVKIQVKDFGIGIKTEMLSIIFDEFTQANKISSNLIPSTGLGLTFCRMAVEKQNGKIEIQSKEREWTIVSVFLPKGKEIKNKILVQENFEEEFNFNEREKEIIKAIAEKLKRIEIYKVTNILSAIEPLKNEFGNLKLWYEQIKLCGLSANDKMYRKIINNAL